MTPVLRYFKNSYRKKNKHRYSVWTGIPPSSTLRDQIEACTNAANTSAVWKHLKRSERETDAKIITSTKYRQRETALRCLCLWWEEEGVVVAGYCDDWNREMDSQINYRMLCFLKHARMACIQTALHELAAPGFKVQGAETLTHHLLIFIIFFKGVWQCDTCDKHLPKFVTRYIWEITACCCQQTAVLPGSCIFSTK